MPSLSLPTWLSPDTRDGRRMLSIIMYSLMVAVSLVMRLIKITYSDNGTPVFDEKHYAPQAHQMLLNGGIENDPGYGLVVHPPLGKALIAVGEHFFGYTPLGWRFTAILAGVVIVLCVMGMLHRLTGSIWWAMIGGLIMNTEGTTLVMSRIGMLDIFLCMFISVTALLVLCDMTSDHEDTPWHRRWLLLGAGITSGLGMAVKISGVYYPALIGVVLVVVVAWRSRDLRQTFRALGMGLVFFCIIPMTIFLMSWTPWFADESSPYRHAADHGTVEHPLPAWLADLTPNVIDSFASYQIGILKFHTSLTTSAGNLHPWESKPWEWLYDTRPMLFWDQSGFLALLGKSQKILLVGNPAVWMLFVPVFVVCVIAMWRGRQKTAWAFLAAGMSIGYFPWLASWDRQMYFFYILPIAPFLVIALVMIMRSISRVLSEKTPLPVWVSTTLAVAPYTLLVLVAFGMYTPWIYGLVVDNDYSTMITLFDNQWAQRVKK